MSRLGFLTMPWSGHLNPFSALAGELEKRGHQNLFFHLPEFEQEFRSRGLKFRAYGEGLYLPGTFAG
ncbi:MAG: glycosyl transferase, partial [Candidatus Eremiobacteraeota bacterium]|nr:glycosyl transferase [Candidatus Eremiobacteraeota bacterium]